MQIITSSGRAGHKPVCTRSRRDLFYVRYVGAAVVPYRGEPGVHLVGHCRCTGKSALIVASCPVLQRLVRDYKLYEQ